MRKHNNIQRGNYTRNYVLPKPEYMSFICSMLRVRNIRYKVISHNEIKVTAKSEQWLDNILTDGRYEGGALRSERI